MAITLKNKPAAHADGSTEPQNVWPNASKPALMLVPRYVKERKASEKTQRNVYYAGIVVAAVSVLAVVAAFLLAINAKGDLDDAGAAKAAAQAKTDKLQPIADYYDGLEARSQQVTTLLSNDVLHAKLFQTVSDAAPKGTSIETYRTAYGVPCMTVDPFAASTAIGCISVTISVSGHAQAAEMVKNLSSKSNQSYLSDAFVKSVMPEGDTYKASVNVNFVDGSLSGRYDYVSTPEAATTKEVTP